MRRKTRFLLGCVSGLFMLGMPFSAMAEDTIKLGVVEPFSGNFKDVADRYTEGIEYAVKKINDGGGLLGQEA